MAIFVRKNSAWHALTGAQIAKSGVFHTVKWNDKAYFGGIGYQAGFGTVEPAISSTTPPTFVLDTEPIGPKWYVSPTGSGTKDGTSWVNASDNLSVILLGCSSGDSVYIMEGEYNQANTLTIPDGVSLYGGFDSGGLWADRSFDNHSKFTGTGTLFYCETPAMGQIIDGVSMSGYDEFTATGHDISFKNLYVVDSTIAFYCDIGNSIFKDSAVTTTGSATDCSFDNCSPIASASSSAAAGSSATATAFLVGTIATNCSFYKCSPSATATVSSYSNGPKASATAFLVGTIATNCSFYSCFPRTSAIGTYTSYTTYSLADAITFLVGTIATNCSFYNCAAANFYSTPTNTTTNSTSYIIGTKATNCLMIFCKAKHIIKSGGIATFCTFVYNDGLFPGTYTDCVAFNNSDSFGTNQTNCAQSLFHASNALTLGTDNAIAKFTTLPIYDSVGVQDIEDCPNPATDETGFNTWVAAFGDYHPESTSYLKGLGVDVEGITTDLDGATRLSPPTVGAYEAKTGV